MNVRELILELQMLDQVRQVLIRPVIAERKPEPRVSVYYSDSGTDEYIDVDVYIQMPNDEGEWKFRASYAVGSGRFYESDPQYASNNECSYEDADGPAPDEVRAEFFNALPEAFDIIREKMKERGL